MKIFGKNAEFHSTFIHTVDDANLLLETSGVISGRGAVSATFTMPKQSTDFLFTDLAGKLIPKKLEMDKVSMTFQRNYQKTMNQ